MRHLYCRLGLPIAVMLLTAGCSSLPWGDRTVDTSLGGMAITRNKSPGDAILGAYGFKRDSGEFERQGVIDWKGVGEYEATVISISRQEYMKLGGSADAPPASASANLDSSQDRSYRAVLLQLRNLDTLVKELNDELAKDGHVRTVFYSPTARIVSSVVMVYDHKAKSDLAAGAKAGGTLTEANLKGTVSITAEGGSKTVLSLADGQIGAYQLVRACWNRRANKPTIGLVLRDNPGKDSGSCERESAGRFTSTPSD